MTTPTTRPVRRITIEATRDRGRMRRTVVQIGPGDVISFRPERTRKAFTITVAAGLQHAMRLEADAQRRAKAEARKAKGVPPWPGRRGRGRL